jgi:predicted kinase
MDKNKLYIVMVGLPARGKSTISAKLKENMSRDRIKTRIFNNGDLRRKLLPGDTSYPEFYDPHNREGVAFREKIALINLRRAKGFLAHGGHVAILDATNVSRKRREKVQAFLDDHPLLFVECVNNDQDILEASILRKITLPEFSHLETLVAVDGFKRRIHYYDTIYSPLTDEPNFVKLDSLNNKILHEEVSGSIPYYDRIRDSIVTASRTSTLSDTAKPISTLKTGSAEIRASPKKAGNRPIRSQRILPTKKSR